jgi:hypothetical protein
MNGSDMQRVVGRWMAGLAIRRSLAELHRHQQATPPATAAELLRHRHAERAAEERRWPEPRRRAVLR